jgi:hypothetical protein
MNSVNTKFVFSAKPLPIFRPILASLAIKKPVLKHHYQNTETAQCCVVKGGIIPLFLLFKTNYTDYKMINEHTKSQ